MELMRLNQHEENDKKKKVIALKASSLIQEESDKKRAEDSSSTLRCYECNQLGHLRVDFPMLKKRIDKSEKKVFNEKKAKKAYITWDDNDMDSFEESENEVVNLSLRPRVMKVMKRSWLEGLLRKRTTLAKREYLLKKQPSS